ncbi:MAG: hypothetical protein LBO63_06160 [Oscillospiraceae bacterium]|jgi:hypothetical protein|nr:hypothetical protein [Oscillospiraceae bacterium]
MKKAVVFAAVWLFCLAFGSACANESDNLETQAQGYVDPYYFFSEEELREAIYSEEYSNNATISQIDGYFVPENIEEFIKTEGLKNLVVAVRDFYIAFDWEIDSINDYDVGFAWYRTMQGENLAAEIGRTTVYGTYELKEGYYVFSANNDELEILGIEWQQNGFVFHANVPKSWSWEQVKAFCTAEWVQVTPPTAITDSGDVRTEQSGLPGASFSSEEEFAAAIATDPNSIEGNEEKEYYQIMHDWGGYFVPGVSPEELQLVSITVQPQYGYYSFYYKPGGGAVQAANLRAVNFIWMGGVQESLENYLQTGGAVVEKKDNLYIEKVDVEKAGNENVTEDMVWWEQNGQKFQANVPKSWSWEQVKAFCAAEWVPVTP